MRMDVLGFPLIIWQQFMLYELSIFPFAHFHTLLYPLLIPIKYPLNLNKKKCTQARLGLKTCRIQFVCTAVKFWNYIKFNLEFILYYTGIRRIVLSHWYRNVLEFFSIRKKLNSNVFNTTSRDSNHLMIRYSLLTLELHLFWLHKPQHRKQPRVDYFMVLTNKIRQHGFIY